MKLTILGVDVECEDKVLYATEELSREYIKAMKDTNGNTITEEEFMKDIGHGVERTQENWKSFFEKFPEFYIKLRPEASMEISSEDWNNYEGRLKDFISTLLAEERELQNKLKEIAINTLITDVNTARKEERNKVLSEVEREVEKKQYYSDDGQQYVTSIEDISTIINNLKVK